MSYRIEQTQTGADIVIDGWERGISDSPYASTVQTQLSVIQTTGLSDMRNMNIISVPTEASVNFKTQPIQQLPITTTAYTAATSGVFTYNGTVPIKNGTRIGLNTLSGGTVSLQGFTMTGTSALLTSQTAYTSTGVARVVTSSNTLTGVSAIISIGFNSQPNNGDVVTFIINGTSITMNLVSSIGSTAGNVLIGATLAATVYNIIFFLQNPGITNATQVKLDAVSQALLGLFSVGTALQAAFDGVTLNPVNANTSFSFSSHSVGAAANMVAFLVLYDSNNVTQTATWGGVSMTSVTAFLGSSSAVQVFMLPNPGSGVKTIAVSGNTGTVNLKAVAVTYSGLAQLTTLDASITGTNAAIGTITQALTTVAPNTWTMLAVDRVAGNTANTGVTTRVSDTVGGVGAYYGDSNGDQTPAGSYTMSVTKNGGGTSAAAWVMFSAAYASSVSLSNVTVGLYTTANYFVQNATTTTFTLTGSAPDGSGVITNIPVAVPASASGTFSTNPNIALFTQIVPNSDNTVYYGIDTNGRVWCYNLTTSTNWIYLGNTATAAAVPDFNTGISVWNGYIHALYDGPSGYQIYTRPLVTSPSSTITTNLTAATDIVSITSPSTLTNAGVVNGTQILYTGTTRAGLVANTIYYAGVIDATTFKLYPTAGLVTPVDITVDTGGQTFSLLIGTAMTFTAFKTLLTLAVPHRTFVDKNNTFYWCDGKQIGSLIELTTYSPSDTSTYTYSSAALAIQKNDVAQCMEQLGTTLIIGGIYNQAYIWDRFSTGYNPLFLPENNTHRMVTVNSNTYLFVGNRGRIYITNGANAQLYKKVPDHLSNTIEPIFVWGGAMYNKNQLYFSISAFGSSQASEVAIPNYGGIWAIDTNTDAMRLVNQLSYGTYGGYAAELCSMQANATVTSGLQIQNFGLICSWEDSTESASPNYGTDVLPVNSSPSITLAPYSNYESYADTDMIPVGTYLNPATDANVEFKLAVPMVAGEGLKIGWRQNLSQSFTDITTTARPTGEFTSADVGSGLSGVLPVNFQKSQWLQLRVYTKSTATTPSYARLKEVRIR